MVVNSTLNSLLAAAVPVAHPVWAAVLAAVSLFATLALLMLAVYALGKKFMPPGMRDNVPACRFLPNRVQLRAQHGDVIRKKVAVEGPAGLQFTTYVEEPWIVVSPASGLIPQEIEILIYTGQTPYGKRRTLLVRLLPVDMHLPAESLELDLRLRRAPGTPPEQI